ncbi:MAG: DUF5667 domain-containing protein [Methanoregula sp.]|nr:DUF5667 domain-containing protein [Methanoregula sp.]
MMKTRVGILFSLMTLALISGVGIAAAVPSTTTGTQVMETIAPYTGPIDPGNSLYGLKIAFENLDESFTYNQSEKLGKQVSHADLRLAELKQELADNSTKAAEIALEQYWQKLNQTEEALLPFPRNDTGTMPATNDTGLLLARNMIIKHQQVLEDLLQSHPDNHGLARAYNNSIALEQKFEERIETRTRHQQEAGNGSFIRQQNMTPRNTERPFGHDDNMTMPIDENQSWSRENPSGNFTGTFPQEMNQSLNRNGQDPHQQQGNTSGNTNNNQSGNTNTHHNINNNANQNNNNVMNPANGNSNRDTNDNRNTGSMNGGNINGNTGTPSR